MQCKGISAGSGRLSGDESQTKAVASKTQLVSAVARFSKWFGGAKFTRLCMSRTDGTPRLGSGQVTLSLRTAMWRFWLQEAIDAAVVAAVVADEIPPLYEQFDAGNPTEEDLDDFPGTTVTAKRFKHPACDSLCTSAYRPANALACGDALG
ncbi:hypothetical protein ABW17_16110 [Mycobacterium nebraskense]|nr:hypothetical protein ABW17_16110 [Mycobacterium nebraskense]